MAIRGDPYLLAQSGYGYGQISHLHEVSESIGRDVIVEQTPRGTMLSWDFPHSAPSQSFHHQTGIKTIWRGSSRKWEVFPPGFSKTQLTEDEPIFLLPIARPGGEQISFNPFKRPIPGGAVGTYSYPGSQRRGDIQVRAIKPAEVPNLMKRLTKGEQVEFWRFFPESRPPVRKPASRSLRPEDVGLQFRQKKKRTVGFVDLLSGRRLL